FEHDEIQVDVRGSGYRESDDIGDVLGAQRGKTGVDRVGFRGVTAETHQGEFGFHHSWRDFDKTYRGPEVLCPQRGVPTRLRVLGRGVAGAIVITLQRGDRVHGDQYPVSGVDQLR